MAARSAAAAEPHEWDYEMYLENGELVVHDWAKIARYNVSDLLDRMSFGSDTSGWYFYIPDSARADAHQIIFDWSGPCLIEAVARPYGRIVSNSPQLVIRAAPGAGAKLFINAQGIQTSVPGTVTKIMDPPSKYATLRLSYDGTKYHAHGDIDGVGADLEGAGLKNNEYITFTGIALRDWNGIIRFNSIRFKRL